MKAKCVLLLGLVLGLLAGCATKPAGQPSWLNRFQLLPPGLDADAILLDVALIRQPFGDRYLNQDLWLVVDEQSVPLERKPVLETNGLRMGTLSGNIPAALQNLLTSERDCIYKHRLITKNGNACFQALGPADRPCTFKVYQEDDSAGVAVENVQCGLALLPSLAPDGQTLLKIEPCVRRGAAPLLSRLTESNGRFPSLPGPVEDKYPTLSWVWMLAPNEYAVVGGLLDRPETMGCACFMDPNPDAPAQYLLVIRSSRPPASSLPAATSVDGAAKGGLPLALQSVAMNR